MIIPSVPDPGTTLVLRRTFKATRQRVFRAWITPRALESWMSFRGMAVTVRSLDARVGGSFRFEVEDGGLITGTYLRIVPPEKLVFTWVGGIRQDMETVVTLDFLDRGSVTEVVLTHEWLSKSEQRTLAQGGWSSMLAALASVLSSELDF